MKADGGEFQSLDLDPDAFRALGHRVVDLIADDDRTIREKLDLGLGASEGT